MASTSGSHLSSTVLRLVSPVLVTTTCTYEGKRWKDVLAWIKFNVASLLQSAYWFMCNCYPLAFQKIKLPPFIHRVGCLQYTIRCVHSVLEGVTHDLSRNSKDPFFTGNPGHFEEFHSLFHGKIDPPETPLFFTNFRTVFMSQPYSGGIYDIFFFFSEKSIPISSISWTRLKSDPI